MMQEKLGIGVTYTLRQTLPSGEVRERVVTNLVPSEGLDYILEAAILGGSQITQFFVGLIDGVIVPGAASNMAAVDAVEFEGYAGAFRPLWDASKSVLSCTNAAAPAEYALNADTDIKGVFLTSNTGQDDTGMLLSLAVVSPALSVVAGSTLNVVASFAFTSSV